jgi:endo-1,3-1,4-beta-glycanase ExoK
MIRAFAIALIALLSALPVMPAGPDPADSTTRRLIAPSRWDPPVAVFPLRGVKPRSVRRAYLRLGAGRQRLGLRAVRRAARRGVLRVRVARRLLRDGRSRLRRPELLLLLRRQPGSGGWRLVFEDTFDAFDRTEWSRYDSRGHSGNGLRRPEAFTIVDDPARPGNRLLAVTARMVDGELVSGGMAHRRNYTYGAFEARVRTEADPSGTMSGVVLTWPEGGRWPYDGEFDIYETGRDPDRRPVSSFAHWATEDEPEVNRQQHWSHDVSGTAWHVFRMEWAPNRVAFYVDGVQHPTVLTDPARIVDVPHHLTIQLDAFASRVSAPVRMYVDWVRIYR